VAISSGIDETRQARLFNAIKQNDESAPPFHVAIDVLKEDHIVLWATMSPGQLSDFSFASWEHLPNLQTYLLDTKDNSSMVYWFYPPNFDFNKGEWKKTREYVVLDPLKRLNISPSNELKITKP
jgi:hypothetical protein